MTTPDAGQRLNVDDIRACAQIGSPTKCCEYLMRAADEIERLRGVEARYEWLKASSPGGCWWSEYAPSEKDFDAMVDYGIAASRSTGAADVGENNG